MTSSIVNYIVEKYLANILEINPEETKSSLWGGSMEMNNLKIKPSIFQQINLPYFELVHGYIGSLKINLSLPRFWKYPLKISIDKVFFHVRQKSLEHLNEEQEIKSMEDYKGSKLDSMEELNSQVNTLSSEEPGMVQQIINNLHIEIGEVVFRFDDDISVPGSPFMFGLILKKILIKTTTDKYEENAGPDNIPFSEVNHKLVKVQGLSMFLDYSNLDFNSLIVEEERDKVSKDLKTYLDQSLNFYTYCQSEIYHHSKNPEAHHYLLYDLNMAIKTALNENIKGNKLPKMSCNIHVDNLSLNLELKQLTLIFKVLAYINLNTLYRAGIQKKYYNRNLTLEEQKEYMHKYIDYYKCQYVKKYLDTKKAGEIKQDLRKLTAGLTYDQVQSMHQAAMIKISFIIELENYDNKLNEINAHWKMFSYFRKDDEQKQNLMLQKEKLLGDEAKIEQMIQEQLTLQKANEIDQYKDLPDDWVNNSLNLEINKCVLTIGELDCRKLIDLEFVNFEIRMLLGLKFQNIFLYLNDFYANQYKFKSNYFNRIIETYEENSNTKQNSSSIVNLNKIKLNSTNIKEISEAYSQRKGALYIEFENNPANVLSNYRLKLRNEKRLYIFANFYSLQYTMKKVVDALKSNIDMNELSNYAKGEVKKYIEEGYVDKIFSGEYTHNNIDADIHLKGPILIIPQNIMDMNNSSCMLISMGECRFISKLSPRMDPLVDYTRVTDERKMYDCYSLVSQGFSLSTMGDFTSIPSIYTSRTKLDIIENINIEITMGNLIEPKNEFFENLRLGIKILTTQIYFRDIQIEYMIYFLDAFNEINKLLKSELDKHLDIDKMPMGVLEESIEKSKDPEERRLLLGKEEEQIVNTSVNIQQVNPNLALDKQPSISTTTKTLRKEKQFIKFVFELSRLDLTIMKSMTVEERSLFNKCGQTPQNPFKNYLNFVMNNFSISVSVSDKKDTQLSLGLFNMFLFDYDYNYKIGNTDGLPQQDLLLNPEFQCILGSINEESHNDGDYSRSVSFYSEAKEDSETLMKNRGKKIQSFIQLNYDFRAAKNKSDIKINFTKLLICVNLSTFARLIKFGKHYGELYTTVTTRKSDVILDRQSLQRELSQLREAKDAKKAAKGGSKGINKKFFKKVLTKMEKRKAGTQAIDESNIKLNDQVNQMDIIRRPSIRSESVMPSNILPIFSKSKINFSFEMKEIELNIPLKADEENTKVIKLNFNMIIKLRSLTECDSFYSPVDSRLLRQNYLKKNLTMNMMIFNVDFDILNFRNSLFVANPLSNKILSNSRVTLGLKSFLILEKETTVTNLDVHVEPISTVIGFRQVKYLTYYLKSLSEFNAEIATPSQDESLQKYQSKLSQKIQEIDEKIESQVKYNTTKFNSLTDVNFKLDKAIIKLIDNTSYYDVPLTKIEASKISFKFIANSDPCDSDNMAQALVEMISNREVSVYNIFNLYLYLDACFNAEILSYNEKVSDWEPIMEPWNATLKVTQVNKVTRLKLDFISDVMLNLNLSYSSVGVFNGILKKLSEDESKWFTEDKKELISNNITTVNTSRKLSNNNTNDVCLEIVNFTGMELSFWFMADTSNKFLLRNKEPKYFTKNEMSRFYKSLTDSDVSLLKKDKLSFSILNCDPVEGVDFSFNHYSNIRVPLNRTKQSVLNQFNFIEMTIKIKNSGLMKSISIESNLMIQNNTNYTIALKVMKTREFIESYNNLEGEETTTNNNFAKTAMMNAPSENSLNTMNLENCSVEEIEPNGFIRIPVYWMFETHVMLGAIVEPETTFADSKTAKTSKNNLLLSNSARAYKVFYNELNFIYKLGEEFCEENQNESQTEEEKEKATEKLTNTYSKIVSFDYETSQVNLSLDLLLLRSTAEQNHNDNFSYVIAINPPIVIENQIPYNLTFSYGHHSPEEISLTPLPSLQKHPIFYVNYLDNRSDLLVTLDYFNATYESKLFSFLDEVHENKKKIKLFRKGYEQTKTNVNLEEDYYEIIINYGVPESLTNIFNFNYLKLERNLSNSKKMTFYVDFLIVTKLDYNLYIKSESCKEADSKLIQLDNNILSPHKVNLFNLPAKENKVRLKSDSSEWSTTPINIETHGLDGIVSLQSKKEKTNEEINHVNTKSEFGMVTDLGIHITSSSYFTYSTVLVLSPGYMLVNDTSLKLLYRQMKNKIDPVGQTAELKAKETKMLDFFKIKESIKDLPRFLQFSLEDEVSHYHQGYEDCWSPTIDATHPEEFNIKVPIHDKFLKEQFRDHIFTYDGENCYILLRIIIHTSDNSMKYIIISLPKYPQMVIRNSTDEVIEIKQHTDEKEKSFSSKSGRVKIPAGKELPFTWSNILEPEKRIVVKLRNKEIEFTFEKIEKGVELVLDEKKDLAYFSILMENNNKTRVLKIQWKEKDEEVLAVKEVFTGKKYSSRIMKATMSLRGFGLSIIDETPKEVFFISTYKLIMKYTNHVHKANDIMENTENIELYIKNFQIDYCGHDSFPLLFFPKVQALPSHEGHEDTLDSHPFVMFLITRKTIHNLIIDNKTTKVSQIDVSLQEMCVKIDQSVLNTFLSLVNSFLSLIDFHKANDNSQVEVKELPSPGDYCPTLKTEVEAYQQIIDTFDQSSMIFIENLFLGALKISLTLRIDISTIHIGLIPGFVVKILGTLGNALARITDSPLSFTDMRHENIFTDVSRLTGLFTSHYKSQAVTQFYKIIGSSDLIGNPVGLVDKLGTGFIEFFNEPRKGFMQGPKGIGEGVAKGINSLVSNVIGGGFDTVGKITGTLLTATKNLQGEKINLREEDEPDNVISGAYDGVKGGITELGKGLAGIFINPYKNAKQEGVKGFFKGVGTGLLGAIISPFSAVLKVGNSLAVGLRNTATYFNRGKIKTVRFRHPRHIVVNEALKPYDETFAEVQAIIRNLKDVSDNKLIFFADFQYVDQDLGKETSTLIITDRKIIVVYNAVDKVFQLEIASIRNTEVHIVRDNFLIVFFLKDGVKRFIMTVDVSLCCQVHGILQKLIR